MTEVTPCWQRQVDRLVASGPDQERPPPAATAMTRKPSETQPRSNAVSRRRMVKSRSAPASRVGVSDLKRFVEDVAIENLAREGSASAREIVESLPGAVLKFAQAEAFSAVMSDIATWGPVCILLTSRDGVFEFNGVLPPVEHVHGYYYWVGEGPIRGRLHDDRCSDIAFIEREFLGRLAASVVVFNVDGNIMLKIVPMRDADSAVQATQLKAMRALARRVCRSRPQKAARA